MIKKERLAGSFAFMVGIDSVSREEGNFSRELRKLLEKLGAEIIIDASGEKTGSDTGNLIARLKGNRNVPPLLLNAHMDTVEPGRNIMPQLKEGVFTSDGTTILGADDKSAIAILLEALTVVRENDLPHPPLEIVFTVCEEIGLLGAKHLDYSLINARFGYGLDATDTDGIITRAPSANRIEFKIHGKEAHAGAAPEKGINAIVLASRAIAGLDIGRIDGETTCNIGVIEGGIATNIVPGLVTVKGEVRSHDPKKLEEVTGRIVAAFREAVESFQSGPSTNGSPRLEVSVENDFPRTDIPEDHPVVQAAMKAAERLNRKLAPKISGGGADANIFFNRGIVTGVLGTGMRDMHTKQESVRLDEMIRAAELLIEILSIHAETV